MRVDADLLGEDGDVGAVGGWYCCLDELWLLLGVCGVWKPTGFRCEKRDRFVG